MIQDDKTASSLQDIYHEHYCEIGKHYWSCWQDSHITTSATPTIAYCLPHREENNYTTPIFTDWETKEDKGE